MSDIGKEGDIKYETRILSYKFETLDVRVDRLFIHSKMHSQNEIYLQLHYCSIRVFALSASNFKVL